MSEVITRPTYVEVQKKVTTIEVSSRGLQGVPGEGSTGSVSYERTFNQSNLSVAGMLPIVHGLNTYPSGVMVWNQSGEQIMPDRVEVSPFLPLTTFSIDLQSFMPISGLWRISIAP